LGYQSSVTGASVGDRRCPRGERVCFQIEEDEAGVGSKRTPGGRVPMHYTVAGELRLVVASESDVVTD